MSLADPSPIGLHIIATRPRTPRAIVPGPTKRPHGGRPNPCADPAIPSSMEPLERRRMAVLPERRATPKMRRDCAVKKPAREKFEEAIARGDIAVGDVLRGTDIARRCGVAKGNMYLLAMDLVSAGSSVRLREVKTGIYRILGA